MKRSQLLLTLSLATIAGVGGGGVLDPEGLFDLASGVLNRNFQSQSHSNRE